MISSLLLFGTVAHAQDIDPSILTQVWVTAFDQDENEQADPAAYGDPEDDRGFKLRRARAGFTGVDEEFFYGVVFGMSSGADGLAQSTGTVGIVDAYAGWEFRPELRVTAGVQKVPFGREQLMSSGDLVFQDRAVTSSHIAPGRELGLLLSSGSPVADLHVGVFNGNGSIVGDDNEGLLYAARAVTSVGSGLEDTYGVVDQAGVSVGANVFYDQGTATDHLAYGADLLLRWSGLAVLAELHLEEVTPTASSVDVPDVFAPTQRLGAFLQAGWSVGVFEPAVRVEIYDDDRGAEDNGDLLKAVAGVTGHFADDAVRAGVAYVHRMELAGQNLSNDTARLFFQMRY